jgi:hypothetical protein
MTTAHKIRRVRGTARLKQVGDESDIVVDDTGLKVAHPTLGTALAVTDVGTQTISGNKTFSGTTTHSGATAFTGAQTGTRRAASVTAAAGPTALAAADSGLVVISTASSGTQVFTLPLAATAGLMYSFVCGDAGTEIHVGVASGDNIIGKTHGAENGTGLTSTATTGLLKNTAASNVVGDFTTLVSDGTTHWYMVAVAGVWSVT